MNISPNVRRAFLALALTAGPGAGLPGAVPAPATSGPVKPEAISFKVLAGFRVTDRMLNAKPGQLRPQLPQSILALDGRRVTLLGYMLPTKLSNRMVTEFLLMRTQNACCYGIMPELNEIIEVRKLAKPVKILMDTPIRVVGRLKVQESWEDSFICSIYQMDVEEIAEDAGTVR